VCAATGTETVEDRRAEVAEGSRTSPEPLPAAPARRIAAQARFDARLMLRNGEQVLLTLLLPAILLVVLARTQTPWLGPGHRIDVAVPGVLALAVLSSAFTGQAIGTGFDRRYGVLRLLGTTPLGRSGLLAGRTLAVLVVVILQTSVLGTLGLFLGWRPHLAGVLLAVPVLLLGVAAFVALGLLLAGTVRAEAVLAVANLTWVLLLAGGGVVLPPDRLGPAAALARVLPSGALADLLRSALGAGRVDAFALGVLACWTALAAVAVSRWFRWD